jgi:hypothetical protein
MKISNVIRGAAARSWAAMRGLSPRATLGIGFLAFLAYSFPGYMSPDSVQQLHEGRTWTFTAGHPPVMAFEWGILDRIVSGPILMLLLQGSLFLWGLYSLLRRAMSPRAAAWLANALLLFPPILTTMGVIWKDSQMAAYFLAGAAALFDERRWVRIVGWSLVTAGCAFRYNAFAGAVPLIGLAFVWRPEMRWWQRYAISGAAAVLCVVVAFKANRALAKPTGFMSPAIIDIAGVLAFTHDRTDEDLLYVLRDTPLHVRTGIQAAARFVASPRHLYDITHGDYRVFDDATNADQQVALNRAWRELIASDWRAYVRFRLDVFKDTLGLTDAPLWSPVWNDFLGASNKVDDIEHNASRAVVQQWLGDRFGWLARETPLFRQYIYALLALALLIACCRDRLTFTLLVSGLLYELSFLPATGSPDYRYSHWLIVCTCLSTVLLFVRRLRTPKAVAA